MELRGKLWIDPGSVGFDDAAGAEIEVVIPYTFAEETRAVMERAAVLTKGLNARISLVAVHALPYASTFGCPTSTHAFLVARLLELSAVSPLPVSAHSHAPPGIPRPGQPAMMTPSRRCDTAGPGTLCTNLAAGSCRNLLQTTLVPPDHDAPGNINGQMNVAGPDPA